MKNNYILAIFIAILTSISVNAQVSYSGNGNSGFGSPIGGATMTVNDDGTTITFTFTKGAGDFNDSMVMYISSGATGRTAIDGNVNDQNDDLRKAISNIGSGDITFSAGFEVTHAVAINTSFGGLWSIPNTGSLGNNDLVFVDAVGFPAATTTTSFSFSFDWTEIGLTSTDKFDFVITYGNPTSTGGTEMFSADEAFGDGISSGNPGISAMTFTGDRSYPNTWTGTTDTDWATATNWTEGIPSTTDNVYIPNVTNQPTASATVTINKGVIKSGASLIAQSTFAGTLTYERNLGTTNWYMVSSPVTGQGIVDFYTNESPALGSGTGDTQNVAIAPYDNSQALANDRWNYYTEGQVDGTGGDDTTDTFTSGTGYTVKMEASGDIAFTGTMPVTDFTALSLTDNSGGSGNAFNLMGNPYPSYIASDNTANPTNNILTTNVSLLTEQTIWIWDQSFNSGVGRYETRNNTSGFHIAPGQAFFVSANGGSSTFAITENMQSHQSTDSFLRTVNSRPEVKLEMTGGSNISDTNILYIDGTTTGFDNGYDSSIFGGVGIDFAIYTQAVANGTGRNLGIQSLPNNDFMNMIIPVGIIASNGTEITISASSVNLPAGINVYLEDKDDNSFTLLDATSDFTTTLASDINGIGRFYIRTTTAGTLSADDFGLSNVSIYTSDKNNLRVVGIQNGTANIRIYNILGKQVLVSSFEGNGVNDVTLPNIDTGIYIIQLETNLGKLNKKIIIE